MSETDKLPNGVLHTMRGIEYGGAIYIMEEDCRASHNAMGKKHAEKIAKLERELQQARAAIGRMEVHHKQCPVFRGEQRCECDANYAFAKLNREAIE